MAGHFRDEAALVDFLAANYDLGRVTLEKPLAAQGRRAAYQVRGERGCWVVKVTEPGRVEAALQADVITPFYLAKQGFPAPCPLPACDGRLYRPYGDSFLYLYEYIEGDHPRPDGDFYCRLGGLLARLHSLPVSGAVPRSGYRPEEVLPGVQRALGRVSRPDLRPVVNELLEMIGRFPSFAEVPEGIQHSDPYFVNLVEDPAGKLYLIDWDDGGVAYPLLDVAYVVAHMCTFTARDRRTWGVAGPDEGLIWRPDWAEAFLAAYQSVRRLTPNERRLLPDAIRLSFLVYIPAWDGDGLILDNYLRMKMVDWDRFKS